MSMDRSDLLAILDRISDLTAAMKDANENLARIADSMEWLRDDRTVQIDEDAGGRDVEQ